MGSKLLRAGDTERGFSGFVNRRFDSVRYGYTRALTSTLQYRPVVLVVWIVVAALMVPVLHVLAEGTGACRRPRRGVRSCAGLRQFNDRPNQVVRLQVYNVYNSFPESENIFQITDPSGGIGGMVTKPWSERKQNAQQLLVASSGPLSKIAGVRVIPLTPPPLPGGGNFPVDFVIASSAEPQQLLQFANQLVAKAFQSGMFILPTPT